MFPNQQSFHFSLDIFFSIAMQLLDHACAMRRTPKTMQIINLPASDYLFMKLVFVFKNTK